LNPPKVGLTEIFCDSISRFIYSQKSLHRSDFWGMEGQFAEGRLRAVQPAPAEGCALPIAGSGDAEGSERKAGVSNLQWICAVATLSAACAAAWGERCTPPASFVKAELSAISYASLGNWYGQHEQIACAAQAFAQAVRLEPTSAIYAYLWGMSLYSAGDDEEAVASLLQAEKLDPSDIRTHLALGAALEHMKMGAKEQWRAALDLDANNTQAAENLSQDLIAEKDYAGVVALLDKPARSSVRSPLESLNLGLSLAAIGRTMDAARVLGEGLKADPDSLPIAREQALVLMLLNRNQEACALLEHTVEKHPEDESTQVLYLRFLVTSKSDRAAEQAENLLASYPKQWEVRYLNGVLAERAGELPSARAFLEQATAMNPGYTPAHHALGNLLAQMGEMRAAKEELEKAIVLGDKSPEVHYYLARALQRMGDGQHAQEEMSIYKQLKNELSGRTMAAGNTEWGDRAMRDGAYAQAAEHYRDALANDPQDATLYYKLSRALDRTHDTEVEREALLHAIALDPKLAEAQNQLGYLAVRGGDAVVAESYFRAAVRASDSYVVAWVNLAATLASESKWDEADEAVKHARALDAENAEARRLSEAIAGARAGR
jgi:tetratricopeptide (TPR) repeat protein